jgi:hypothetical protein
MSFQLNLHLVYNCHTGHKLIVELSKLLEGTGYMVMLPFVPSDSKIYHIACTNKIKSSKTDGRFVVFVDGQYGVADVSNIKPDLEKTNWDAYGENLIKTLKSELFENDRPFLNGKKAIAITYEGKLVIPRVEIVSVEIQMTF